MIIPGYRIERELAHGGMATVYLAVQESLERQVAIKVMAPALAADRSFGERFLREARTVARLHHPNILSVFDVGVEGHHYYLAMEYIPGGDLKQRIRQGALPPQEALGITRQLAQALGYAHEEGFVHRDVKPENVLFRRDGTAVLSDFGIAKAVGSGTRMTGTGMSIGTPHYMSPEQARGQEVDGRSDLYSLGIVLYEMLTGQVPYDAGDSLAIGIKHLSEPLPQLGPNLGKLQPLLDRLLTKDPGQRFQNAGELIMAIDQSLSGQTLPKAPQSIASPTSTRVMPSAAGKPIKSGSGLKWALGGALLALIVAGGMFAVNSSKQTPMFSGGGGNNAPTVLQLSSPKPPPNPVAPVASTLANGDAILQVNSSPAGAEVYLDGNRLGVTPLTRSDLPGGSHQLQLSLKYYNDHREKLLLAPAEVVKKQVSLQRGEGKITVLTRPSAGTVTLDGKLQKEKTPLTMSGISAGEHQLKIHLDRYYDQEQKIEVSPDETAKLDLQLEGGDLIAYKGQWLEPEAAAKRKAADEEAARKITLTVKTVPADATVRILNIQEKYKDGIVLKNGEYTVEVSSPGFETWRDTVTMSGAARTETVTLKKNHSKYPLKIYTTPGNAKVEVFDEAGRLQNAKSLENGTYTVMVSLPGYESWSDKVVISDMETIRTVELESKLPPGKESSKPPSFNTAYKSGRPTFSESFDDNHNSWPTYNGTCYTKVEQGKFVIEGRDKKGRSNWILLKKDFNLSAMDNFMIETTIKRTGGQDNYGAGLVFCSRGIDTGYRFEIDAKYGSFILGTVENKKWKTMKKWTQSSHIRKGNQENTLAVKRVNGSTLELLINGHVVHTESFPPAAGGQIGYVVNYDVDIEVDDIAIWELPGS